VKTPAYSTQITVIRNVVTYSFSLYEDDSLGFWAAGKAGWYEIGTPAKGYADILEDMKEATAMWYYLADKFKKSRIKGKPTAKVIEDHCKRQFSEASFPGMLSVTSH
jgi:hypothetical protein